MTEKLKNKEMEDIHFADEKKIEKLEKKLSNFQDFKVKTRLTLSGPPYFIKYAFFKFLNF